MGNILTIAQTVWLEMIRKKDIYIILTLQAFFTFLLTTINAFGSDVPSSYILDIGLMLAFVLSIVMSIIMGSRQIPSEIRTGTIYSILTKPITRFEFISGKFFGLWVGMIISNALFYLIVTAVTLTKGFAFEPIALIQTFGLHSIMLAVVIAFSLFFSTFSSQGASGTGTGIFVILCYLFVPRISNMMAYESGIRYKLLGLIYYISPHLELFDMRARVLHNWGVLDAKIFIGTLLYGILLTAVFLTLAWLIFRKKYFKRGANV